MSYPQPQDYNNGESEEKGSRFAITTLSARIGAMISFIVAIAVFQTNDAKIDTGYVYTYKDFRSYKYGFWVALIGFGYTVLQVPFSIHYMMRKKHLINSYAFLKFDLYADKVVALVVTTAAGAVFGATMDMKKYAWRDEVESFLSVSYIAAAFLLAGSIACWISSLHSSLALSNKLRSHF
ncbi:CASP-like protein PIMP1 isoform X1 [Salvia splendens]|uniref:CASP-like protein PIMP1 isoform X1 n=1 Tax=Salvia splendens TaxID=180675 RepID=UPI001C25EB5D|nr:CASP-like protein PIMP1 isoform X1 [Salvia splendens]